MIINTSIDDNLNKTNAGKNVGNNADMGNWYLLQCKPREESRANDNLENQGFTTFLPEISIARKTKAGFTEAEVPLFPGYLFIKINNDIYNRAPIRSTRGVNKLVSFGQTAAVVPDTVIDTIKQQTYRKNNKETYPFEKGDKLTIATGPFKELQAVFDSRNGQQRAWVFLELMGKWQRIAINDVELNKVA